MKSKAKRTSALGIAAIGMALLCVAAIGCVFLFMTMTSVSGTASLPNGTTARINGPFSCSDNKLTTAINAGGRLFTFSPTTISVDGVPIGPLDATITDVRIDASYWSASLHVNGSEVPLVR